MKFENRRYFNIILYMLFAIIYLFVVKKYGMGAEESQIRYYMLVVIIAFGILSLLITNFKNIKKIKFKEKKFLLSIFVAILFLIISIYKAKIVDMKFNNRTVVQICLFLLPTIYAFIAINIFSKKEIIYIFKFTTIALIIAYFTEEKHTLVEFLKFSNWSSINFLKSNSFTESHLCARSFSILFLVFYYIYITDKKKSNFYYMIINFIFTLLCFKRLDIIMAIFIILFGKFLKFDKKVSVTKILITTTILSVLTMLYISFLKGDLFNSLDSYTLTSGRNRILALWAEKDYLSYGYGTSMLVIKRYLELDLVQIYLELNLFALLAFVYVYLYLSKNSRYSYFIILYVLLNMLTASSLANTLAWVVQMLAIAYISNNTTERIEENGNNIEILKK